MDKEIFIGHLSTRHFDFYFVADSEQGIKDQAAKAWAEHRDKTGATWTWEDVSEDLWCKAMPLNTTHKR